MFLMYVKVCVLHIIIYIVIYIMIMFVILSQDNIMNIKYFIIFEKVFLFGKIFVCQSY